MSDRRDRACRLLWLLTAVLLLVLTTGPRTAQAHPHPDTTETDAPERDLLPVTLQLNWHHGYVFAGYYAAKEMGFYAARGLDVHIIEQTHFEDPVQEVLSGRADFGVAKSRLVADYAQGDPVVALAAIMQKNNLVLLSRRGDGPTTAQGLAGKRICYVSLRELHEVQAMLLAEGVEPDEVHFVFPEPLTADPFDALANGDIDVLACFLTDLPARYADYRAHFNVIRPSAYGVEFYGDCLFTHRSLVDADPELVEAFREATLTGWRFALVHVQATARVIQQHWCPDRTVEDLVREAELLEMSVRSRTVTIGRMNEGRWQHIVDAYRELGLIEGAANLDGFIYTPPRISIPTVSQVPNSRTLLAVIALLGVVVVGLVIALYRAHDHLGQMRETFVDSPLAARGYVDPERLLEQSMADVGGTVWQLDLVNDRFVASEQFLAITGYEREEVEDRSWRSWELFHPDDVEGLKKDFKAYLDRRISECNLEYRFRCKDGTYRWINSRCFGSWDENDRPVRMIGTFLDASGRIEAEIERDRLFNLSIDLLAVGSFDGYLQQLNPAWVRVLGWSRDELMAQPILFFVHPDDQEVIRQALIRLQDGEPVHGLENRFRCRNGTYRWLSWSSFPYADRKLVFSVVRDISDYKQAEKKLLDYQERLRSLSNQMSLVEDRQRRQLASAIHDGLAQQLFGIRAQVTLLKYPEKIGDLKPVVESILQVLDDTMADARNLSFELFPPVLQELGLEAALKWLAHQFNERTGVACHVKIEGDREGDDDQMAPDVRAMAYQSVRELLANVQKHAEADRIDISLNCAEGLQTIIVEDNGKGFEVDREEDRTPRLRVDEGFGLFSIRERLRSIGGRMLVDSRPGHGCRVFLSFPCTGDG